VTLGPPTGCMTSSRMKADWLRITNSLEQLEPALAEPSKRLFAEFVSGAALYDRLEMLEGPIQFALGQYELANTRLIEANLAHKERNNAVVGYVFEVAIGVDPVWWTPLKLIFEVSDAPLPNRLSAGVPATDGRSGAIWTHARRAGA
jgi:hypothetical protein